MLLFFEISLVGCLITQRLARTVVQSVLGVFDLSGANHIELHPFGKVLTDQAVGVLVQAAFPRLIWTETGVRPTILRSC